MPKVCGYWERWACVEGIMQMLAMFSDDRDDLHKVLDSLEVPFEYCL